MLATENETQSHKNFFVHTLWALGFLLVCRIIAMYFIPLNDATESRYGEIARKMLETGNWVTLQHDYGVPFWAKPPLSSWLSALSMQWFGVNEFAVRLPGLLLSLLALWLVWDLAKKHSGLLTGRIAALVLAGTLYFYLDSGTVMTDPALVFSTTLCLVAFWYAMAGNRYWSYVFFVGLGLGLLAKGPVALVITGLSVFFWVLLRRDWRRLWQNLPWFTGICLTLAIALPWYIMAERRTPGFLRYFIVGEHFNRFLISGWTGDKYGMAHNQSWGMIWVYLLGGIFPWCLLIGSWFVRHWKDRAKLLQDDDGWMLYLLSAMLAPLLFFTFSSNIIYTYVFPSLPAFALLFAECWQRTRQSLYNPYPILFISLSCGFLFLAATCFFYLKPELVAKTQKSVVQAWADQHPRAKSSLIYWDYKITNSAQFYAKGRVKSALTRENLHALFSPTRDNYLVVYSRDMQTLPHDLLAQCKSIKSVDFKDTKMILLHCPAPSNFG